jgi:hypothetical protein
MSNGTSEIKDLRKQLQEMGKAIVELRITDLAILKIMAGESCETHYHAFLPSQKGEEINRYGELWSKRLADTRQEINQSKTIEDVITARDKFVSDIIDYVRAAKVDTADKAMEIAHSFIKKYVPVALPLKAVKEGNVWLVDIDVGALSVKIAKVKVDARTGDILSYDIPTKESKESK